MHDKAIPPAEHDAMYNAALEERKREGCSEGRMLVELGRGVGRWDGVLKWVTADTRKLE
jgi:hypothetical protein